MISIRPIALCVLAVLSGIASADNAPSREQLSALTKISPETQNWQVLTNGLFEGQRRDGSWIRVYSDAAKALFLSELKSDLRELEESLYSDGNADSAEIEQKIKDLRNTIEGHMSIAHASAAGSKQQAKATQHVPHEMPDICGMIPYAFSAFTTADVPLMVDSPTSTANFAALGDGTQWTSVRPFYQVYRTVSASLNNVTTTDAQNWFSWSTEPQRELTATAGDLTFYGSCSMQTTHSISVGCEIPLAPSFLAITTQQTCSGAIAGTPPDIGPTP